MPAPPPDLTGAAAAIELARSVITGAARHLAEQGATATDVYQVIAYDLAHSAAAIETAQAALEYGRHGPVEAALAAAFAAEAVWDLATRLLGREARWGAEAGALSAGVGFRGRPPGPGLAGIPGRRSRAPPPRRRLRAGGRHLPEVRRGTHPPGGRAHSPRELPTSPRRSSPGSGNWAPSGCRSRRRTAVTPPAASTTISAWSSPPRNCRGRPSGPAGR